jgi:hypothetical protein
MIDDWILLNVLFPFLFLSFFAVKYFRLYIPDVLMRLFLLV